MSSVLIELAKVGMDVEPVFKALHVRLHRIIGVSSIKRDPRQIRHYDIQFCCILVPLARVDTSRGMTKQQQAARVQQDQPFKGRQFTAEVILWAVRWYLMFPISYRDLELMLLDRGVEVDHTTLFRWIQTYAAELEKTSCPYPA